jgi:hypothetical protein
LKRRRDLTMIVFKVSVYYVESTVDQPENAVPYWVVAENDIKAREKALAIDDRVDEEIGESPRPRHERVQFCEIAAVCELSE